MTMTTTVNVQEEFTAQDRCDKCGAQAKVRASLLTGELLFCGHHGREVSAKLLEQAVQIYDPEKVVSNGS